ncbi:WD40 repeat domain-containing protein [Actinomadura atramentaria]|uniref:WD40 repeat domain-containing protein n=1 Tax=Actinomadura atramentaria TaxID=1990 RepID=UPI00036EAE5D|nr:hypothetical protein [Actinomadura atramentaria]
MEESPAAAPAVDSVAAAVTRLGEAIAATDFRPRPETSPYTLADFRIALDTYDAARRALDREGDPTRALILAGDGQHVLNRLRARLEGREVPQPSLTASPCFFNAAHGPATASIEYQPPGGTLRTIGVCSDDAALLVARYARALPDRSTPATSRPAPIRTPPPEPSPPRAEPLTRALPIEPRRLVGHRGEVVTVALGRLDGRPIAVSGSEDRALLVWDLETGKPIGGPLRGHGERVDEVALLTDGDDVLALSRSMENAIIWNVRTGARLRPSHDIEFDEFVEAIAVARIDGRPIGLVGIKEDVRRLDLRTGDWMNGPQITHSADVTALAVGRINGTPVMLSSDGDDPYLPSPIHIRDCATGAHLGALEGHEGIVKRLVTAESDGRTFALSAGSDRTARLWDLDSREQVGPPLPTPEKTGEYAPLIALARLNGRLVAATSQAFDGVLLLDAMTHERLYHEEDESWVWDIALADLGSGPIAAIAADNAIEIWDLAGI